MSSFATQTLKPPSLTVPLQADDARSEAPRGKQDLWTAREYGDFTLKLDRSDAKITIANIRKALCMVHGTWSLLGVAAE